MFFLNPGERGVLSVVWSRDDSKIDIQISTHPLAPDGLRVLPGTHPCDERMTILVENEFDIPVTVTEYDFIAIGAKEEDIPSAELCAAIMENRQLKV